MAMQTLKYEDNGFASVAVDQAGNFVTDNAGNLVIPIEPFKIECVATDYGSSPDYEGIGCNTMTVTLPDRTVSYYLCPDEFKSDEIAVFKNVNGLGIIYFNVRTLKEKYGDSFTMTVDVLGEFERVFYEEIIDGKKHTCEDIYYNRGDIKVWWGKYGIGSCTDSCKSFGHHTAKFTVNFADMTISSDTASINVWSLLGTKCDKICYEGGGDDDPYEVTAYCDVELCSNAEISVYRSKSDEYGDWLFSSSKVTVTVHPDRGETPESELQKAAICSVINEDYRKYIVTSTIDPKRYYRDESKDIPVGTKEVTVYKGTIAGRSYEYNDYNVWFEQGSYGAAKENGKRIFSNASSARDITEQEKANFSASKLQIGVTEWTNIDGDNFPWTLHSAVDEAGNLLTEYTNYGYIYPTGKSVTLTPPSGYYWFDFGFADDFDGKFYEFKTFDDKFTVWWIKYYNQSSGLVAAFPGEPYFGKDEWDFWELLPQTHASNGAHRRSLSSYDPPVTAIDGLFYDVIRNYIVAKPEYVWDFDVVYSAWSLSPCYSGIDTTIYTEKDYGGETGGFGVGDAYAIMTNGVLQWQGTIVASGNALYSVTGSDGIARYWKADIDVQEETDEEFE